MSEPASLEELRHPELGVPVKAYSYRDEAGRLLYYNLRFEPKNFRPWRPGGGFNLDGVRRVPYNLPQIAALPPGSLVFWAEGEKDADRMIGMGLAATTAGSATSWRSEFATYFRGQYVVIIRDSDEPGEKHARAVASDLLGAAAAAAVFHCADASDISEWLDHEFARLRAERPDLTTQDFEEEIARRVERSNVIARLNLSTIASKPQRAPFYAFAPEELTALNPAEREMLVGPIIGKQEHAFFYGPKGHGKTWIALGTSIIAAHGEGAKFLTFTAPGPGAGVLFVDGEMMSRDISTRARDIMRSLGHGHRGNLKIWTPDVQPDTSPRINLFTEEGRTLFENHIADVEDELGKPVELVIFDNLRTLFPGWVEKDAESFQPISLWTIRLRSQGRTVVTVHHSNKTGEYSGSTGIITSTHSITKVCHPDDYHPDMAANFDVHFEWTRYAKPGDLESFNAQLDGNTWSIRMLGHDQDELIRILADVQGQTERQIADHIGKSKTYVHRRLESIRKHRGEKKGGS